MTPLQIKDLHSKLDRSKNNSNIFKVLKVKVPQKVTTLTNGKV